MFISCCKCCGQLPTKRYEISVKGHADMLYDLCQKCAEQISKIPLDKQFSEISQRNDEFNRNYSIIGFEPIIVLKDAALNYSI
jgi:hypothetical protein